MVDALLLEHAHPCVIHRLACLRHAAHIGGAIDRGACDNRASDMETPMVHRERCVPVVSHTLHRVVFHVAEQPIGWKLGQPKDLHLHLLGGLDCRVPQVAAVRFRRRLGNPLPDTHRQILLRICCSSIRDFRVSSRDQTHQTALHLRPRRWFGLVRTVGRCEIRQPVPPFPLLLRIGGERCCLPRQL